MDITICVSHYVEEYGATGEISLFHCAPPSVFQSSRDSEVKERKFYNVREGLKTRCMIFSYK